MTLVEVLPDARDPAEVVAMSTAASEFLTEVLAAHALASAAADDLREQLLEARREIGALRSALDERPEPSGRSSGAGIGESG